MAFCSVEGGIAIMYVFINNGEITLTASADELRNKENSSIDEIFRRYFKC